MTPAFIRNTWKQGSWLLLPTVRLSSCLPLRSLRHSSAVLISKIESWVVAFVVVITWFVIWAGSRILLNVNTLVFSAAKNERAPAARWVGNAQFSSACAVAYLSSRTRSLKVLFRIKLIKLVLANSLPHKVYHKWLNLLIEYQVIKYLTITWPN